MMLMMMITKCSCLSAADGTHRNIFEIKVDDRCFMNRQAMPKCVGFGMMFKENFVKNTIESVGFGLC